MRDEARPAGRDNDTLSAETERHLIRPFRGTFPSEGKAWDGEGMETGGALPEKWHTIKEEHSGPLGDCAAVIRAPSHEDWIRMRISDLALEIRSCIRAGIRIRPEVVAEYNEKVTRRAHEGKPV